LGIGLRSALGTVGRRLPALTCVLLVAVGIYTVARRTLMNPLALTAQAHAAAAHSPTTACCEKP
jgi:hypothetical protein